MGVSKGRGRLIKQLEIEFRNKQRENEEVLHAKVLLLDYPLKQQQKNLSCNLICMGMTLPCI